MLPVPKTWFLKSLFEETFQNQFLKNHVAYKNFLKTKNIDYIDIK